MKFDTVGLKRDIDKYYKSFIDAFIENGTKLLEDEALNLIDYYYEDYPDPKFYIRTNDFRLGSSIKSYVNKNAHYGYVDLLNDIYDENFIYSGGLTDKEIRIGSWRGYHGRKRNKEKGEWEYIMTIPSPLDYLMEFYYGNEFRNKAISKAKKIANSNSYTYLKKK